MVDTRNEAKEPKDLRYRRLYFPDSADMVFDTAKKGFVPLPIVSRKLLRHLSTPEFRVLMYLYLRCSKYGICYPTTEEMAYELRLEGKKNLTPHIRRLESYNLITTKQVMGKKFYLVHDPRLGLQHFLDKGSISDDELIEINQLLIDLGQELLVKTTNPTTVEGVGASVVI